MTKRSKSNSVESLAISACFQNTEDYAAFGPHCNGSNKMTTENLKPNQPTTVIMECCNDRNLLACNNFGFFLSIEKRKLFFLAVQREFSAENHLVLHFNRSKWHWIWHGRTNLNYVKKIARYPSMTVLALIIVWRMTAKIDIASFELRPNTPDEQTIWHDAHVFNIWHNWHSIAFSVQWIFGTDSSVRFVSFSLACCGF